MSNDNKIIPIPLKKSPFKNKFFQLSKEDIPKQYSLLSVPFKEEELREFDVILLHRLMKESYGNPSEIEIFEDSMTDEDGKKYSLGKEWKYYLGTRAGEIFQVGTEKMGNFIKIYYVLPKSSKKPSKQAENEAKYLVNQLVNEIHRQRKNLFNIKEELERSGSYILDNIFLKNLISAEELFLLGKNIELERTINFVNLDLDLSPQSPFDSSEECTNRRKSAKDFLLIKGTYYSTSILYFFLAFESFINLIYHIFLKLDSTKERKVEEDILKWDINLKILLITSLCDGFKNKATIDTRNNAYRAFKELREYRNQILHGNVADHLQTICCLENGFFYTVPMKNIYSDEKIPLNRVLLQSKHVLKAKNIAFKLIGEILKMMKSDKKKQIEKIFFKKDTIWILRNEKGQKEIMSETK